MQARVQTDVSFSTVADTVALNDSYTSVPSSALFFICYYFQRKVTSWTTMRLRHEKHISLQIHT